MEMESPNKLGVVLCDLATCFTPEKLNSHDVQLLRKFRSGLNNNKSEITEVSDTESNSNLSTSNFGSVNGKERNLSFDKKLVVELCDFMVCLKKNCNIPDCDKYSINEQMQEQANRKVDQHYFPSRKKRKYKEESDDDLSDEEDSDVVEVSDSDFEEETSEEISSEEADDSDWEEKFTLAGRIRKKLQKKEKKKQKENEEKKQKQKKQRQLKNLSSYELERQKHLDEKMAFLNSLKMNEIVDDFEEAAKSLKKSRRGRPKVFRGPKEIREASRRSKRMENVKINLSEEALITKAYATVSNEKQKLPSICPFEDVFCKKGMSSMHNFDKYFRDMEIKEDTSNSNSFHDLNCLDEEKFSSYAYPFFVSSMAFHPAVDRTIMLAGSSDGHISLWNTDYEPYCFTPHADNVTLIKVNQECSSQIYSSSHDGTIRQTDIEKKSFVEVFQEDNIRLQYFDFISPNELLVAQHNGCVSHVDFREKKFRSGLKSGLRRSIVWKCSSHGLRTINVHPIKKDLCLSLDSMGSMKIWDRRFCKESVSNIMTHSSVLSAFFSPVTGNSVLCSSNLSLRFYDSSSSERKLKLKQKFDINHEEFSVQRWQRYANSRIITKPIYRNQKNHFSNAHWLPKSDEAFIVSDNVQKETIIMESNDGKKMSSLKNPGGTMALQELHPVYNILAVTFNPSGHSSKMHLYMRETDT